ncbi:hypothetical protein AV530_013154 [Patagioenas fasciata monilis]|uniref:Uncharacterized protein n=1 Tax=Patagioenas fasciata monilis TaxID=372326 RepID=A0A1V4KL79_PATFA|nr:hypothetical protein AV530_013154 [Patagioenas fasciata monilis]
MGRRPAQVARNGTNRRIFSRVAMSVPSQKPKEQQRSVLRPAVLQAPQPKAFSQMVLSSGTNGVNIPPDSAATSESLSNATLKSSDSEDKVSWSRIGRTLNIH